MYLLQLHSEFQSTFCARRCGKMKKLLSPKKIFRQIIYLANLRLKTFFQKMFAKKRESESKFFRNFHTTVIAAIYSHTFWEKFRESIDFTKLAKKETNKELI